MIGQLDTLLEQLDALQARAIEQLEPIQTSAELEEWDTNYLGRKRGELTNLSSVMSKLSKEERPIVGQKVNAVKDEVTGAFEARKAELAATSSGDNDATDVTEPGRHPRIGHLHILMQVVDELTATIPLDKT